MILVIDNYDSFTYNLVQFLGEMGADLQVVRNDQTTLDEIRRMQPTHIVISPGPGTPDDGGVSLDVIKQLGATTPILGVCLGHQCIGQAYGGVVLRADHLMHGKTSLIYHKGDPMFDGVPSPFEATRYHSLIVEEATLPDRAAGDGLHRRRRDHGDAAQGASGLWGAVPSRKHPDGLRAASAAQLFGCESGGGSVGTSWLGVQLNAPTEHPQNG